ncbi:MAG TPA: hypothetical protein VF211_11270 [Burkholderiales bacterium]
MRPARLASLACGCLLAGLASGAAAQYRLDIDPPPSWRGGWKQAANTGGQGWRLLVYMPADAVEGEPSDLVSITRMRARSKDDGVKRLVEAWALQLKRNCKVLSAVPDTEKVGEEFNVGYAEFYCPERTDTGAGATDVVKVMAAGNEAHLVAVTHMSAPFRQITPLAGWVSWAKAYLESEVRLCRGPLLKRVCSP